MKRQVEVGFRVFQKPLRCAVAGKFDAPAQHVRYGPVAQQQRCIFLAEPFDDLHRHAWLGPGFDFAGVDDLDAATAPTGLHGGFGLALDQRHFVAGFSKIPGRGSADCARTQNNYGHDLPLEGSNQLRLSLVFAYW